MLSCSHCLKFLGTRTSANSKQLKVTADITPVPCDHCDHEFYCSANCRDLAWSAYHKILCYKDNSSFLGQFEQFAERTSHRLLLSAKIIASMMVEYSEKFPNVPFDQYIKKHNVSLFCRDTWLKVSVYDPVRKTSELDVIFLENSFCDSV
jgi:hypothetical protein